MSVTINDVANEAGVSKSTVSKVLNSLDHHIPSHCGKGSCSN